MKKYIDFVLTYRPVLIVVVILMTLFAITGIFQLKLNTDFSLFTTENSPYEEKLTEIQSIFGETNETFVVIASDHFTTSMIQELVNIQQDIQSTDEVTNITGGFPETIVFEGHVVSLTTLTAEQLTQYYSSLGEFSPYVEKDGIHYFIFNVFASADFSRTQIKDIETTLDDTGFDYYMSGDTYNQSKIVDFILQILFILPPLAIIIMLLIFKWQMKAIKATIFSVLPAIIGSIWTLGLIGWLGNEVSILTAIVPIFIIVIGSADGLHFMSHYQVSKLAGKDTSKALVETLKIVGVPMIMTTLTSIAGFMTLLSMNTNSVADLAIFSSVGILLAGVATWFVLPLILSKNVNILPKKPLQYKLDIAGKLKKIWGIPIFVVIVIILVLTTIFFSKINNEFNMLMIYKNHTLVVENAEKVQEISGGSIPIYVLVPLSETEHATTLNAKTEVDLMSTALLNMEQVTKVVNPYDFLQTFYNMQTPGEIPNDFVLNTLYNNVSSQNDMINNMVSSDLQYIRLLVFTSDQRNATLNAVEEKVSSFDNDASVASVQYLIKDLNVNITSMQLNSILISVGLIFVMLLISLRRLKIAFMSILPITITVLSIYAFLGISQIPLNITTVIIFSITIGVGIDYAVHFSSVYTYYLKQGQTNKVAINQAYDYTSRPIIANALGISLGMSVLMLSPLMIHFYVSSLMWVSMIIGVLMTLTLLPTIFKWFGDKHA